MTESRLPPLAVVLGIAGLIPFFACALATLQADPGTGQTAAIALISYGAVILSFLGGVHWGFVIEGAKEAGERRRLTLGVVPALVGWSAVLLGITAHAIIGIAVLVAAFIAAAVVEQRGRRTEMVPRGYMILRWALTVVVALLLSAVLVLRLMGGQVLF
jgi:hypothetical protein